MAARQFTRQEVAARNHKEDLAIIIDNVVYDVTKFLDDHPGGPEVLLDNGGKDASQCFQDVGHSEDAIEWRKKFVIGEVVEAERLEVVKKYTSFGGGSEPLTLGGLLLAAGPPALLALAALFLYSYLFP